MQEVYALIIGMVLLILGIPIGNLLAKATKEELRSGKRWFRIIVIIGLIGAVVFLIFKNDILLFIFLFMAIVTSRSLRR